MNYSHIAFGKRGEDISAEYLEKNGYQIVERNFRVRTGEIDIIAEKEGCLIFVEVKTRHGIHFGRPCEAVTVQKQKKIYETARHYCVRRKTKFDMYRFDVIEIVVIKDKGRLRHLIDAYRM